MKSDPQRIRHFVPLLAAAIGDYTGEIEHEECPKPILLSDATDVKSYVESFFVESFRTEWMDIDTLPLDHDKTPAAPYPPISPFIVTSRTSVPDWYAQRRIGWEVAIVGSRGNAWSPEAAIIGEYRIGILPSFLRSSMSAAMMMDGTMRLTDSHRFQFTPTSHLLATPHLHLSSFERYLSLSEMGTGQVSFDRSMSLGLEKRCRSDSRTICPDR